MRPGKVSIGDLRDSVEVFRATSASRTATGGIVPSVDSQGTVYVNITSKIKEREKADGSIYYVKEYEVLARAEAFENGDELAFEDNRISIVGIDNANAGYIKAKGISMPSS